MKRTLIVCTVLGLALFLYPQQQPTLQHLTGVTNVEVPVRVYDGDKFIDNLALNDFEVRENGVPQKIAAVYLVRKTSVMRREITSPVEPNTHRTFYLDLELYEYIPRLREALAVFVNRVLQDQDDLVIITPMKTYKLKSGSLAGRPRERVVEELNGLVRKDIVDGNVEYRHALDDLKSAARQLTGALAGQTNGIARLDTGVDFGTVGDIDEIINQYRAYLARLDDMRSVDEKKMLGLARYLKEVEGQKFVFLFYQREFTPLLDKKQFALVVDMLEWHTQLALADLFNYRQRKPVLNADEITKTYSDSSIAVHFLFLTPRPEALSGVTYEEHSEDIFAPFLEIAKATGGMAESTANPAFAMQRAGEASENYYLLYYAPGNYVADGKFKEIKVSVKGKSYTVTNRAGYFAN